MVTTKDYNYLLWLFQFWLFNSIKILQPLQQYIMASKKRNKIMTNDLLEKEIIINKYRLLEKWNND